MDSYKISADIEKCLKRKKVLDGASLLAEAEKKVELKILKVKTLLRMIDFADSLAKDLKKVSSREELDEIIRLKESVFSAVKVENIA